MSVTTTYTVVGMTCEHCVNAVTEELSSVTGVEKVAVDLESGRVSVTSLAPLPVGDVRQAVDEAGYVLAES